MWFAGRLFCLFEDNEDAVPALQGIPESSQSSESSVSSRNECEGDPRWSGYLVTGDLRRLAEILPDDGELTGRAEVEPALILNLTNAYCRSIYLVNGDRARATAPADCPELQWPLPLQDRYLIQACLAGPILLEAGYNCEISQDTALNEITIGAFPGAGAGRLCDDVPLFIGDEPPEGRSTRGGYLTCAEVVRGLGGAAGRNINILGGQGVRVEPDPDNHKIVITVDMRGMAICYGSQQ